MELLRGEVDEADEVVENPPSRLARRSLPTPFTPRIECAWDGVVGEDGGLDEEMDGEWEDLDVREAVEERSELKDEDAIAALVGETTCAGVEDEPNAADDAADAAAIANNGDTPDAIPPDPGADPAPSFGGGVTIISEADTSPSTVAETCSPSSSSSSSAFVRLSFISGNRRPLRALLVPRALDGTCCEGDVFDGEAAVEAMAAAALRALDAAPPVARCGVEKLTNSAASSSTLGLVTDARREGGLRTGVVCEWLRADADFGVALAPALDARDLDVDFGVDVAV